MPLTSLLVADDQEKLPTGQCRPRVPPSPINLRGDAYLNLQKVLDHTQVREEEREREREREGTIFFFFKWLGFLPAMGALVFHECRQLCWFCLARFCRSRSAFFLIAAVLGVCACACTHPDPISFRLVTTWRNSRVFSLVVQEWSILLFISLCLPNQCFFSSG